MSKQIIILAMHRSGSSVVAGILHHLGVDMGEQYLMPPSNDNPKGYFEDVRFVGLNQLILRHCGGAWNVNIDEQLIHNAAPQFEVQIKKLIAARERESILWGMKDPRMVLTIPLYMPYLSLPSFIVVLRNPRAIARSLQARDRIPVEQGEKFALDYYHRISGFVASLPQTVPVVHVRYDEVVSNPYPVIGRLACFAGIVPPNFVDPRLKHY